MIISFLTKIFSTIIGIKSYNTELLEFNLLLENIETIEKINVYRDNLVNLSLEDIFKEYQNENLCFNID